jgi:hypothetical protein
MILPLLASGRDAPAARLSSAIASELKEGGFVNSPVTDHSPHLTGQHQSPADDPKEHSPVSAHPSTVPADPVTRESSRLFSRVPGLEM